MKNIFRKKKISKIAVTTLLTSLIIQANISPSYAGNYFQQNLDNVSYNKLEDIISDDTKLQSGMYVVEKDITLNDNSKNENIKQNAIKLDENSNVCIYIKKDATLTVYGKNSDLKNPFNKNSGAAIFVPASTTLSILGEGTLIAYGGEGKNDYLPSPAIGRNACKLQNSVPDESYDNKLFLSDELKVKIYGGKYIIKGSKYKHIGKYEYLDNKLYNKNDKYLIPFNISLLGICNPYSEDGSNKDLEYRTKVYVLDLNETRSANKTINDKTFNEATIKTEYIKYVEDYINYGGYDITKTIKTTITNPKKNVPAPLPPKEEKSNTTPSENTNDGYKNLMLIVAFFTTLPIFIMIVYSKFIYKKR